MTCTGMDVGDCNHLSPFNDFNASCGNVRDQRPWSKSSAPGRGIKAPYNNTGDAIRRATLREKMSCVGLSM
jgi:hypothetical protein